MVIPLIFSIIICRYNVEDEDKDSGILMALNIGFVIFHAISFGRYFTQINLGFGPRTAHYWIHHCFSVSHHFRGCHQEPSIQTEDGSDSEPAAAVHRDERTQHRAGVARIQSPFNVTDQSMNHELFLKRE